MSHRTVLISAAASLAVLVLAAPAHAVALGPSFTYQGQVKLSGSLLNGTADFEFSLWDSPGSGDPPSGGLQIGATQTVSAVSISSGLFTVALNASAEFGPTAFDGQARWLQIAVRSPAGSGSFTTLSPRQALTAAPYALYALNGPFSGGLTLPFAGSVGSSSTAFSVTNTGTGGAGAFVHSGGSNPALQSSTTGGNNGLWVLNTGGADPSTIPSLAENAAVSAWNLGSGDAVKALNGGTGPAVRGVIENGANGSHAVFGTTNGTGSAVHGVITNLTNGAGAVFGTTNGTGPGGRFVNTNSGGGTSLDGAWAISTGTNRQAAGLRANGHGNGGVGNPRAAALDIYNGGVNVSGPLQDRPAGTIVVPPGGWAGMGSATWGSPPNTDPHGHSIGWFVDFPLNNRLIIAGGTNNTDDSIILATVESKSPPAQPDLTGYYVQVLSKVAGQCTFRVSRIGRGFDPLNPGEDFPPPTEPVVVHYMIINPSPRP